MIDAILAAHAEPDRRGATFGVIDPAPARDPNHVIFTVAHLPPRAVAKPEAYPIRGRAVPASP